MKKQRVKYFGKYGTAGLIIGFFGTFIAGAVNGYQGGSLSLDILRDPLLWMSRVVLVLLTVWSLYLMQIASQSYNRYSQEDLDDENDDLLYRKTFRFLEYAQIGFNVAQVLTIINLFLAIRITLVDEGITFDFSFVDFGGLVLLILLQTILNRLIGKVREHKISAFATPEEIKDYIYSYDEGEKESVFENSFLILFQLNQQVLPVIYMVLFILYMMTGELQLVAYLVLAFIHIYINVKQIKQVRNYFK